MSLGRNEHSSDALVGLIVGSSLFSGDRLVVVWGSVETGLEFFPRDRDELIYKCVSFLKTIFFDEAVDFGPNLFLRFHGLIIPSAQ